MTQELIERLRLLEQDHEPDRWPAIRMRDVYALLEEIDRLNNAIKYEQHRVERIGTHGLGCSEWGPNHYECALREVENQRRSFSQSRHEYRTKIMQLEERLAALDPQSNTAKKELRST